MNELRVVTLKREEVQKILDSFDSNDAYIHFALELDSIRGDQVLWADNGKFGNDRAYIRINKPYKKEERDD